MKRLIFFALIGFLTLSIHSQEKRLALVIGNSAYTSGGVLKNPVNDAYAMEQALSDIGFEVLAHYNLEQGDMKKAIDDFGVKLRGYDVGLFFFAGHGIQVNGYNYLIPVEANLMSERYVEYDCVQADRVLANMDESNTKVNILILDACRNNPFERSWTRSASSKGLAFMNAPSGTLIAYATAPGSTASDGEGLNGVYTEAILENIRIPDITVLQVFQNVRTLVSQRTGNHQIPWESTSLTGDFYLNIPHTSAAATTIDSSLISTVVPVEDSEAIANQVPADHSKTTANQVPADHSESNYRDATSGIFTDQRDGNRYKWVKIGDQVWMAENLNYEIPESWIVDPVYGRYYRWEEANRVCPQGWHLPSDREWQVLEKYLGISVLELELFTWRGTDEGGKLKEKGTAHWEKTTINTTNETGFSALPAGQYYDSGLARFGKETYFWTSTRRELIGCYYRDLHYRKDKIGRNAFGQRSRLSVRCLKD